ncbi:MAG: hypothetical protein ACM3MF_06560, partial [Anaerolineae bacterium]
MRKRLRRTGCIWGAAIILLLVAVVAGAVLVYDRGRPVPIPAKERLFEGVTYTRLVRVSPRPLMIHVLTVDLRGT